MEAEVILGALQEYNLWEPAGVAGATLVLIEVLKRAFMKRFSDREWYGFAVNGVTLGVAMALSIGYKLIVGDISWYVSLFNGVVGFVTAIGGYESIVNLIKSFARK